MKKRMRNMLVLSGICVLCFAGYGISLVMQKDTTEEEEKADTEGLLGISTDEITGITYTYEGEKISLTKKDDTWQYAKDSAFAMNQTLASAMADTMAESQIERKISEDEVDMASFGLETPDLTVTVTEENGDSHVFSIGDYNSAFESYYVQEDGTSVYMVSGEFTDTFSYALYDLLVLDEIPAVTADYVTGLEITRDGNTDIYSCQVEETETTDAEEESESQVVWYVSRNGGEKETCDSTEVAELVDTILGVSATEAANYNAGSSETLSSEYGIDSDSVTVIYMTEESEEESRYTLHFGNSNGSGSCYMTVGDSYMVQLVDEATVNEIFQTE